MLLRSFAFIAALALATEARADDSAKLTRRRGETISTFAWHLLPAAVLFVSEPVEVPFGALGKVAVVLFRGDHSGSNYTGWIIAPATGSTPARKFVLPAMPTADGTLEIEVASIFTAEADGDRTFPELMVLYEHNPAGGGEPNFATEVYQWTGTAFTSLPKVSERLIGLRNAGQVRAKLRAPK